MEKVNFADWVINQIEEIGMQQVKSFDGRYFTNVDREHLDCGGDIPYGTALTHKDDWNLSFDFFGLFVTLTRGYGYHDIELTSEQKTKFRGFKKQYKDETLKNRRIAKEEAAKALAAAQWWP